MKALSDVSVASGCFGCYFWLCSVLIVVVLLDSVLKVVVFIQIVRASIKLTDCHGHLARIC